MIVDTFVCWKDIVNVYISQHSFMLIQCKTRITMLLKKKKNKLTTRNIQIMMKRNH